MKINADNILLSFHNASPVRTTLERFNREARTVMDAHGLPESSCIIASALALEVLPRLGLTGVRQLGVNMGALNPEAAILFSLGVPMQDWPATAWSRGICGTDQVTDDGWDGHAVAYVSSANDGQDAWIVDPTASQFSQAGKGLKVGRLVATVPAELLAGEQISIFLPDGTMLRVVRNMALTHHLLGETARDRIIKPLAEQVLARMTSPSQSDRRSA